MASNAFANVRGSVFRTEHRSGTARKTNQPYSMDILHVLVPDAGLTELVLPSDRSLLGGVVYDVDDEVDFVVEIRRNEFGFGMTIIKDQLLADRARANAA